MNEEVDPMSIIDEVIGPDEEEQEAAYQLNRKSLIKVDLLILTDLKTVRKLTRNNYARCI